MQHEIYIKHYIYEYYIKTLFLSKINICLLIYYTILVLLFKIIGLIETRREK